MRVSRAAVFANERKGIAKKIRKDVLAYLKEEGVRLSGRPQLVITIGGDGTVLYNKRHYGVPFFSIGSSTSFICQATFSNWKEKLRSVVKRLESEKRLLLECAINGRLMPLALNEIGIRNPKPRVLSIHLEAGRAHHAFRADGMLFCTPTGSGAYCYSCGGDKMPVGGEKYQAVPISPFLRLFKPTALGAKARCTMRITGNERAQFFIDGQEFGFFTSKDTLHVRASRKRFLFAKA
jgi:NAD+ kinase